MPIFFYNSNANNGFLELYKKTLFKKYNAISDRTAFVGSVTHSKLYTDTAKICAKTCAVFLLSSSSAFSTSIINYSAIKNIEAFAFHRLLCATGVFLSHDILHVPVKNAVFALVARIEYSNVNVNSVFG